MKAPPSIYSVPSISLGTNTIGIEQEAITAGSNLPRLKCTGRALFISLAVTINGIFNSSNVSTPINSCSSFSKLFMVKKPFFDIAGRMKSRIFFRLKKSKHFLDSLSLVKVCDVAQAGRILDVGTGAGFPGIPLKIAFPEVEVVLLDSLNKRVKFLNEVIGQLGLSKITAVHGRAEDFARQKDYREQFDLVVSRAVANLSSLSEYCLPYVKVGGRFVSYKSGKLNEELAAAQKAIHVLGGEAKEPVYFQLTGTEDERSFVCIKKGKATPKKYPRKAGTPAKEPIQ